MYRYLNTTILVRRRFSAMYYDAALLADIVGLGLLTMSELASTRPSGACCRPRLHLPTHP